MSPVSILLIGLAMSADAFAAAIGKGAAMQRPRLRDALRVGLVFATIEALTPLLGWLLGRAATGYVAAYDHWIAFALLAALGLHMVVAGCRAEGAGDADADASTPRGKGGHGLLALATTGVATSIDALAVGVSLAFLDVPIAVVAAVIGACTLVMVTLGILLGRVLGRLVGRRAEVLGGVILILVGTAILYEHLSAAA